MTIFLERETWEKYTTIIKSVSMNFIPASCRPTQQGAHTTKRSPSSRWGSRTAERKIVQHQIFQFLHTKAYDEEVGEKYETKINLSNGIQRIKTVIYVFFFKRETKKFEEIDRSKAQKKKKLWKRERNNRVEDEKGKSKWVTLSLVSPIAKV